MLNDEPFYFDTIRKSLVLFGTLFNNIYITRTNSNGVIIQNLLVPLVEANKEKTMVRINTKPELNEKESAINLPIMSFEISNLYYDSDRKLNTVNRLAALSSDKNKLKSQFGPVPWNIDFSLSIYVKNFSDGTKIVEQIIPYFSPDWIPTVNLNPEMGHPVDVPIVLNSVTLEDSYAGNYAEESSRMIIWTLSFTMKTYLFAPIKNKKIIKFSNINYLTGNTSDNSGNLVTIETKPGLDANGYPTSNSSISINTNSISANDNYGYIVTITENT